MANVIDYGTKCEGGPPVAIKDLASACERVEALCQELGIDILEQKEIPYGRQFKMRRDGATAQLNVYFGKKGLNLVAQGGNNAAKDAIEQLQAILQGGTTQKAATQSRAHENGELAPYDAPKSKSKPSQHVVFAYDEPWIGTDESGKGDFFGGLVTAGVLVDPEAVPLLRSLGVDDSKKIDDTKIRTLATEIRKICYGKYKVLALHPPRYNDLYEKLKAEGKNLNSLLAWAHVSVLENLLEKQMVRLAITDKFADEKYINSRLKRKGREIKLIQVPKAEQNIAVAAASILARDAFLQWHEDIKKQYGIAFPKGASSLVVKAGKSFVKAKGPQELRNVAKLHFKTTEEVLK